MFKVIEGNVFLTDDQGASLTTVSGADGPILKVATDIDLTISGGETLPVEITNVPLPVEEQNLDSEGYINNSAHNYGKIDANWSPFTLTDDGRLRIDIETSADSHVHAFLDLDDTPTTYSGSEDYYLKVKSTADGIEFTTISGVGGDISHFDLQDIGTITHSGIDVHIGDSGIHFTEASIDKYTQAEVDTISGALSAEIDADITTHTGLPNAHHNQTHDNSDHSETYLTTISGGDHTELINIGSNTHAQIDTHIVDSDIHHPWSDTTDLVILASGTLQTQIDDHTGDSTIHFTEAEISHFNIQDIGTTTHSGIDAHIADGDIHFPWSDVEDAIATISGSPGGGIFGSEYGYASSDGESSTTSTSPIEKVSLSKTDLPSGDYHIEWSCEFFRISDKDSEFNARVQINDTTTVAEVYDEKTAKGGWFAISGIYNDTLSGTVDIDLDYWDSDGEDGVEIRRARLTIWRVS